MRENLHGLAANDEGGNATTAMRGHDDEVTAAGPGGFDNGFVRLPVLDFHDLARDTDPLGLLLRLGEATLGLGMCISPELICVRVRRPQSQCRKPVHYREHCQLRPDSLAPRQSWRVTGLPLRPRRKVASRR